MMPFFTLNAVLLKSIFILGFITSVVCSILASLESQPKKVLAYSTSAHLGLMFMAAGIVNIKLALIILVFHAFVKSALFILLPKEKSMPKTHFILFIINALSLSGLLFAGVGVKELLYKNFEYNQILYYLFIFICFLSAFYISRLVVLIYKNSQLKNNTNFIELTAYLILLFGNIALYIALRQYYTIAEPYAAAIGGLALALLLGKHNSLEKFNTPKIMERLFNNFIPKIYGKFTTVMNSFDNKIFANYKPLICISKSGINIINWIEVNIFNRTVCIISDFSRWVSKQDLILQSGNVQTYNIYAFIIVTIIIALVITGYNTILLN